jgi:hypothetical protein
MKIEIPGVEIRSQLEADQRFSLLLWGQAGCGKTALACSAPGGKLLINFDPDGYKTVNGRDDVLLLDLASQPYTIVDKFSQDDPLVPYNGGNVALSKFVSADDIGTIVVDSCSAFTQLGLEKGIKVTNGATIERPSPGAYGARNALTLRMMTCLLRLTGKYNKHIIFITHEDDGGVKNKDGELLHITMLLGGKLASQTALQISEVWHLMDDGKQRKIMVRPGRQRKPMKTRHLDTTKGFELISKYDQYGPNAPYGEGSIANLLERYEANGRQKIAYDSW